MYAHTQSTHAQTVANDLPIVSPLANAIAQDIRRIMRSDTRVMNKLHRRVFVDKITKEDVQIYMSFYLDAANRDAFMAIKQDLMVSFVDCVERNGAKLAQPRTVVRAVHAARAPAAESRPPDCEGFAMHRCMPLHAPLPCVLRPRHACCAHVMCVAPLSCVLRPRHVC
eukprot:1159915-Pelagomonas_calceolata.AAC.4